MFRNKSVDVHRFAMVQRPDVPRSAFRMQSGHKTTFDAGYLVPVFEEEVLPGDSLSLRMTAFGRLATPLFPVMDNLHLDSFFFFVPYRLVWTNWVRMMGERDNPDDSIDFETPQQSTPVGGYAINSLQDYFGLPTVGQVGAQAAVSHSALPLRAYNLIWNEWFRDQNLQDAVVVDKDDGPDDESDYVLLKRGKRHDYFTSALPWPQKGDAVTLPLGTYAPVRGIGVHEVTTWGAGAGNSYESGVTAAVAYGANERKALTGDSEQTTAYIARDVGNILGAGTDHPAIYADLSEATAATINQLREAIQIQRLLERDARGGTRYVELNKAHFGVESPDSRLQRPEYLGGGSSAITVNPIAQTSATGLTGGSTPVGTLAAMGTVVAGGHGFSQSFVEHGIVIGLVSVRADLTYQQGLRRFWSRMTRYDHYWPAFAFLGEQAVLSKEIYCDGTTDDDDVWGYQERWSEYRYHPSKVTGLFRSTAASTIDAWHLAQEFGSRPLLNDAFIQEAPPLERVLAVGAAAAGKQIIFDAFFDVRAARPLPMYSTPGLIDRF